MTPAFKSRIIYLEVNPTWTMPPTILTEDVLPAVMRNRRYLQDKNMRVIDHQGHAVDPAGIDWSRYRSSDFHCHAGVFPSAPPAEREQSGRQELPLRRTNESVVLPRGFAQLPVGGQTRSGCGTRRILCPAHSE
jgi:hypothetical protein